MDIQNISTKELKRELDRRKSLGLVDINSRNNDSDSEKVYNLKKGCAKFSYLYERLKQEWNYSDKILIELLRVNTPKWSDDRYLALAECNEYLEWMESQGTTSLKEVWEGWCNHQCIGHEVYNNPYRI